MGETLFRRYTNLAAAIHLFTSKSITLLNPATWDDTNDAYYMAEYKRLTKAQSVLALCFAECDERYHHWKVFSHGSDGVSILFDKDALLGPLLGDPSIHAEHIRYRMVDAMRHDILEIDSLPFLKRHPYQDENEFRIIFTGMHDAEETKSYPIKLSSIKRVTLSPWLSTKLSDSVKRTLKSIDGCKNIRISRSTLVGNEAWKGFTTHAVPRVAP
jgi:hypothetical protein